jgi:sulfatase modifying factor 1
MVGICQAIQSLCLHAQEARFFRVVGPVPTMITSVTTEGMVAWTNLLTNATFTIQTASSLNSNNWVDWVQVPVSNAVTVHRCFDPNPPVGMTFIPAGSFTMGNTFTNEGSSTELPLHTVNVSEFFMDPYKVTKALWDDVKTWNGGNGYDLSSIGSGKAANHPVQTVSWFDAVKWCNARSQKEGLVPCYYTDSGLTNICKTGPVLPYVNWSANGYRLPTEAEWEKAARGGLGGHRFPWGDSDTIQHSRANYNSYFTYNETYDTSPTRNFHPMFYTGGNTYPFTSPVGYFAANGYGLYDMCGNVWEWCWDRFSDSYYSSSSAIDPRGPASGSDRVNRGGDYGLSSFFCRTACRSSWPSPVGRNTIGFRCVRSTGQ